MKTIIVLIVLCLTGCGADLQDIRDTLAAQDRLNALSTEIDQGQNDVDTDLILRYQELRDRIDKLEAKK